MFLPHSLLENVVSNVSNAHCIRFAEHAMILESSRAVILDPSLPALPGQSVDSTSLAPMVKVIKQQVFSDQVAARIEAPQRPSTRAIYKAK